MWVCNVLCNQTPITISWTSNNRGSQRSFRGNDRDISQGGGGGEWVIKTKAWGGKTAGSRSAGGAPNLKAEVREETELL